MKRKLTSDSGMTLIEIVAALVILIIMVAGFATLFSFAGTSVFISGHDSAANADSRTETEFLLSGPIGEGAQMTQIGIGWHEGYIEKKVAVAHESTDVPTVRGPDGSFDLYRREDGKVDSPRLDDRPYPSLHTVIYDFNGGYYIAQGEFFYSSTLALFTGSSLTHIHQRLIHPAGLRFSHWVIQDSGEEWVWQPVVELLYRVDRSMYLVAVWMDAV